MVTRLNCDDSAILNWLRSVTRYGQAITILTKKPLWLQALGTALSMLASVPLGELFFFHMILIRKVSDFITCHYFCPTFGGLSRNATCEHVLCCATFCRASLLMNMLWPWGLRVIRLDLLSMMISRAWHLLQWVLHQPLLVGARLHDTTKAHGALPLVSSLIRWVLYVKYFWAISTFLGIIVLCLCSIIEGTTVFSAVYSFNFNKSNKSYQKFTVF